MKGFLTASSRTPKTTPGFPTGFFRRIRPTFWRRGWKKIAWRTLNSTWAKNTWKSPKRCLKLARLLMVVHGRITSSLLTRIYYLVSATSWLEENATASFDSQNMKLERPFLTVSGVNTDFEGLCHLSLFERLRLDIPWVPCRLFVWMTHFPPKKKVVYDPYPKKKPLKIEENLETKHHSRPWMVFQDRD